MLPAWQEYYQQQPELLSSPLLFLISGLSTESVNSWKCDVIHKINCVLKKTSVVVNFVQTSNTMSCYINEWVKGATVYCGDKTFTSDASKVTAFLRLIHGWKKLNISNIWLQKKWQYAVFWGRNFIQADFKLSATLSRLQLQRDFSFQTYWGSTQLYSTPAYGLNKYSLHRAC